MKKFLEKYFIYIVFAFLVITMLKGCNDIRTINELQDTVITLQDGTYSKTEYNDLFIVTDKYHAKIIEREGLRTELRFYQSTDRKLMDVERQSKVVEMIKELDEEINELEKKLNEKLVK